MSSFSLTQSANADLMSIARFTEKSWGREQRLVYIKQFDETFHLLSKTPVIGTNCDHIKKGYQKFPQGSHIIFYTMDGRNNILIVRILHKSMDVLSRFSDS